ncbi:MAG TPA: hypothetical protein VL490_03685 [Mucilaginibacter sp.]|jgi:hypothetical protein|nr:hypothetical protein [Mucilaginibacter sp.]
MKRLLYILLVLAAPGLKAQQTNSSLNNKLQGLVAALDSFNNRTPIEKVHLHLDKPYYSLGDTIWIKAYVVDQTNNISNLSKVVYADLVNSKDSVKIEVKLPLILGLGWGAITLSDSLLKEGNYHIRAYTTYMRNFDQDYFFDRSIKISNALPPSVTGDKDAVKMSAVQKSGKPQATKKSPVNISVQFFPEGGELVNGLMTKVAFKAVGADGFGKNISGYIADAANKPVAALQSAYAGMGAFLLQPDAGNTYTAVIKLADSSEKRIALPKVSRQGYAMAVNQNENNVLVSISATNDLTDKGEITLVGQVNNQIKYIGKKVLTGNGITTIIPKSRFPEGIVQFTLFSPDSQPVAERLAFVRNAGNHLNIKFNPDKTAYQQRGKVHLNLEVTDGEGKPISGSFSLAVTDEDKVPYTEANETTIFSNLLLSGDLKGYIEQPNYYFTDNSMEKDCQLDNLLLTQGWRRFTWKDALMNKFSQQTYHIDENSNTGITGRVLTSKNKPAAGAKVSILLNTGSGIVLDTIANADGNFSFNKVNFRKSVSFNVVATDAGKNRDYKVEIDGHDMPKLTLQHIPDNQIPDSTISTYIANTRARYNVMDNQGLLKHVMLKQVDVHEKLTERDMYRKIALQHSQSLAGPGSANKIFTFIDLLPYRSNIAMFIKAMAPPRFPGARYIVVDGIGGEPMPNGNDIAAIEILDNGAGALYGMKAINGVMIVTTKRGDVDWFGLEMEYRFPGYTKARGLTNYTFNGENLQREFYSPDYDNPATDKQFADLRSTIYWKPNIITDNNGKASVDFFNADGRGTYRLIAEGLDGNGNLGRQVYRYAVK